MFRKGRDVPFWMPGEFLGPYPSGAAAIFIHAMACLGHETGYLATIGMDDFGTCLINRLERSGVRTDWVYRVEGHTTGVAFTRFRSDGSREFIYHAGHAAVGQLGPEYLDRKVVETCEWLHLCGNVLGISPGTRDCSYEAARIARRSGVPISFDPNIRFEQMRMEDIWPLCKPIVEIADVVFPSGPEAAYLTGVQDVGEACRELLRRGPRIIALKQGDHGSRVFTARGVVDVATYPVTEVDPTGAGDNYDAGFVHGFLAGWDPARCAQFANALGALTVTRQGAMEAEIGLEEVRTFLRERGVEL